MSLPYEEAFLGYLILNDSPIALPHNSSVPYSCFTFLYSIYYHVILKNPYLLPISLPWSVNSTRAQTLPASVTDTSPDLDKLMW